MATFGQGINPLLGRINYDAYSQGAQQGAQMSGASASKAWGQIGQGIEKGIQEYQLNKKIAGDAIGEIEGAVKASPEVVKWLTDPANESKAAKLFKKLGTSGTLNVNDATTLSGAVRSFIGQKAATDKLEMQRQELENQRKNAAANMLSARASMVNATAPAPVKKPDLSFQEQSVLAGAEAFQQENGRPPNAAELKKIYADVAKQGQAQTNINMGGNAYDKTLGEAAATKHMADYEAAVAAPQAIAKLDEVQSILKSGDVTTGIGAEIFQNVNRLRSQFLNDEKAGKTVSNTQLLDSLLGSDVFPMISALGVGARGMDTPAEREFLRQSFTGTKEMTPEALQRLTEIRRDIQLRAIEKFKKNNESGTYKKFFEVTGNPLPDLSSVPPRGVTYAQWQVMSPEQRALFEQ